MQSTTAQLSWQQPYDRIIATLLEHLPAIRDALRGHVPLDISAGWEGLPGARLLHDYVNNHVADVMLMATFKRILEERRIGWLLQSASSSHFQRQETSKFEETTKITVSEYRKRLLDRNKQRLLKIDVPPLRSVLGRGLLIKSTIDALKHERIAICFSSGDGVLGGIGKTVLARRIAHRLQSIRQGSHIEIDLQGTSAPLSLVAIQRAIFVALELLDVHEELVAMSTCFTMLFATQPPGPLCNGVLLLDNASQDQSEDLSRILHYCRPGACVLITSRALLHLSPSLRPLSLEVGVLEKQFAMQILTSAVKTSFSLTALEELAVRHCHLIPLMLELAAKQLLVPHLSMETLLATCRKNASEGINTVLSASYELLSQPVRLSLLQAASFHVAFRKEACRDTFPRVSLAQLQELLERGFFQRDKLPRLLSLHEVMREFCRSRAAKDELSFDCWTEMTEWYYFQQLDTAEQLYSSKELQEMAKEMYSNDREGILALYQSNSSALLVAFIACLASPAHSLYQRSIAHCEWILQLQKIETQQKRVLSSDSFPLFQVSNLLGRAFLLSFDLEKAERIYLDIRRRCAQHAEAERTCVIQLGLIWARMSDPRKHKDAEDMLRKAIASAPMPDGYLYVSLSCLYQQTNRLREAEEILHEGLERCQRKEDQELLRASLPSVLIQRAKFSDAEKQLIEQADSSTEPTMQIIALIQLASLAVGKQQFQVARRHLTTATDLTKLHFDSCRECEMFYRKIAGVYIALGTDADLTTGVSLLERSLEAAYSISPLTVSACLSQLADIEADRRSNFVKARQYLLQAVSLLDDTSSDAVIAKLYSIIKLAQICFQLASLQEAFNFTNQALQTLLPLLDSEPQIFQGDRGRLMNIAVFVLQQNIARLSAVRMSIEPTLLRELHVRLQRNSSPLFALLEMGYTEQEASTCLQEHPTLFSALDWLIQAHPREQLTHLSSKPLCFSGIDINRVHEELYGYHEKLVLASSSLQLTHEELSCLGEVEDIVESKATHFAVKHWQLLRKLLNWPGKYQLPVLQLARCLVLSPTTVQLLQETEFGSCLLESLTKTAEIHGTQTLTWVANQFQLTRCLANLCLSQAGRAILSQIESRLLNSLSLHRFDLVTLLYNLAHVWQDQRDARSKKLRACELLFRLLGTSHELEPDTVLRALITIGTLLHGDNALIAEIRRNVSAVGILHRVQQSKAVVQHLLDLITSRK